MKTTAPPLRLLRIFEVADKTGKSIPQIYKELSGGTFPRAVATGRNTRAWVEAEIDEWILERIKARDEGTDTRLRAMNPNIGKGRRERLKETAAADAVQSKAAAA